jgi:hypothetical protein
MPTDRDRLVKNLEAVERVLARNKDALESTRKDVEQYRAVLRRADQGIPHAQRALRRAGYLK